MCFDIKMNTEGQVKSNMCQNGVMLVANTKTKIVIFSIAFFCLYNRAVQNKYINK